MPLRIKTYLEWEQRTREGRYETHFIRTVSIDDLTGAHGLSLGLTFHLSFGTDYFTDPEIEIKVVKGLEVLNAVSIHVKTSSGRLYHDNFYNPSIEDLRQESGFSQSTENYCCEYFRDMFKPKNLPRIMDVDVTYFISFDLDLKEIKKPNPNLIENLKQVWMGSSWTGVAEHEGSKLLEKLYKNVCGFKPDVEYDELSDVKIFCEGKIFNCHKLILSGQSKVFKTMLFNNDMVEATSGEINIVDTSANVMLRVLFYIYHEYLDPTMFYIFHHDELLEPEMIAHDVLVAAEKYDIPDLVNMCVDFMAGSMNDTNVVNIMTSSFLTNKKELFKMACKFVFKRSGDGQRVEIDAWKEFKEKDPVLANKMLEEAMFNL